jgi:hypothetical protein
MIFKERVNYTLNIDDYIDKAFPQIPFNAFIDKGRCGIGGTTKETKDKTRFTIIAVPTIGIIKDKTTVLPGDSTEEKELKQSIFPIMTGVTCEHIKEYLLSDTETKKIMTTPDSFKKIIRAATEIGMIEEIYNNYFLLIDECHTIVTESFRKEILSPLKYIWNFKNKSFMSATPYVFSDPLMRDLTYHKIDFPEGTRLGNITLIDTKKPNLTLKLFLDSRDARKENMHIFYNSVTQITEAIQNSNISDCNIFCSESEKNFDTMGSASIHFKSSPESKYAKVNFYTSKYIEGWDLKDENGMIILVTDVNCPHTKLGISNKAVQAFGRDRTKNSKLIHITNHRNINQMKTIEHLTNEYTIRAGLNKEDYNKRVAVYKQNQMQPAHEEIDFISNYADIDEDTGNAEINFYKIDQMVNSQFCDEQFNHIDFIKEAWESQLYSVTLKRDCVIDREISNQSQKRLPKAKKLEGLLRKLKSLHDIKDEFLFSLTESPIQYFKRDYPEVFEYYHTLGFQECEKLKFNEKHLRKALVEKKVIDAELKILRLLAIDFKVYSKYSKTECKDKLQKIYKSVGIDRVATAEQLGEVGRFDIKESKRKDSNGKYINCFTITRAQFDLKMAA